MSFINHLWERFLRILPVLLMGVLALGTYWLVRSVPATAPVASSSEKVHEPDYFMQKFSVRTYDATGRMRTEVLGAKARHYPDTQWLEIDDIQIRSFDAQGHLTVATAQQGLTNEDTSEVQLLGNAVLVRQAVTDESARATPTMEYRGEFLHAFIRTEKIKSHKPVKLVYGKHQFTADTLDFDNITQVLQLQGRVRGTLSPISK